MRRTMAGLVAATAAAATLTIGGWATSAGAETVTTTRAAAAPSSAQDVWILWKIYATSESCRKAGRDMIGVGAVVDYKCEWDSPDWALYLRMVG